jgi:hypothetical protein
MTMRRARPSGRQDAAAAQRVPATSEQLAVELYQAQALRLTRMALLLVGDQPSAEDVQALAGQYVVRLAHTCMVSGLRLAGRRPPNQPSGKGEEPI